MKKQSRPTSTDATQSGQLGFGYSLLKWLSLLGRIPGKYRLANWLSNRLPDCRDAIIVAGGMHYKVPSLKEPVAFSLLIDGCYERETLELMKKWLKPGDVFIDIGANIGGMTIPGSQIVGPSGRVVAIEASRRVFQYLQHNVVTNHIGNVHLFNCAAGNKAGEHKFYDAPVDKFGMGSLARWPGEPGYTMPVRTVDEVVSSLGISEELVRFVKVDVEGFERQVFEGLVHLLQRVHPTILFEFNDWAEERAGLKAGAAQEFLQGLGYVLFRQRDYLQGGQCIGSPVAVGSEMILAVPLASVSL